jgi:hypothetical protein
MCCIMGRGHSLGRNDILKSVYCFMILFLILYIFKYFFTVSTIESPRECNNVVILGLVIFFIEMESTCEFT